MRIFVRARVVILILVAALSGQALAAPPPLEAYGELPAIEELAISPSGQRYSTLFTVDGKRMIGVFELGGKALQIVQVGDLKIRSLDFVSENRVLFQRSLTQSLGPGFNQDKFEFFQAVVLDVAAGDADVVYSNQSKLVKAVFGDYGIREVEGRPKAYFGAIELKKDTGTRTEYRFDHGRPALYEVDLDRSGQRRIDPSPSENESRDWLIGNDGAILVRLDVDSRSGDWRISNDNGKTLARGQNPTGNVWFVTVGRDGDTIVYGERVGNESSHWYEIKVDGSAPPVEFLPDIDVKRIYTDRASGRIIGYLVDGEEDEPVFFDPAHTTRAKSIRAAFGGLNVRLLEWTDNLDQVLVRTDGNQDSGTYYLVDLIAGKAEAIGYERPPIGPNLVGAISTVPYKAADGLEMDGILTLPPGLEPKNLPLVMLPHGGPHSHDTASFDWWAQAFASRGYAVFQPNFRGSTNRDRAFVNAGYGEWGGKMQSDISDGLAELARQGIIDPSRACIVGASYGGYAALAGVTLQNGLYRCAVSVAGVSDVSLMSRVERREGGNARVLVRSLERQLGDKSRYKDISPRYHADKADAPILLIHGRDDTVVAYHQSLRMADALKDAGKPYEFVELKGEDHWLSLADTRLTMLKAAVAFVEKHNPAK